MHYHTQKIEMNIKKLFLITLSLSNTLVYIQTHTMESIEYIRGTNANVHIGILDTLMLARTVLQDGCAVTQQKIDDHEFEYESLPLLYSEKPNPYIIRHHCIKGDGSELSKMVFDRIHRINKVDIEFTSQNPSNKSHHLNKPHHHALDHCTTWKKIKNSTDVDCTTRFYNKAVLLVTLDTIRTQEAKREYKKKMSLHTIKEGALYRHYKGNLYQVIKIAYNTETKILEKVEDIDDSVKLVVYKSVKPDTIWGDDVWWVRPYAMFVENVTIHGKEQPRFVEQVNKKRKPLSAIETQLRGLVLDRDEAK